LKDPFRDRAKGKSEMKKKKKGKGREEKLGVESRRMF
jgi:hypothetical protein